MVRFGVAAIIVAGLALPPGGASAGASTGKAPGGVLSEIKGAVIIHDVLRDNDAKDGEANSVDIGGELLSIPIIFANPDNTFLRILSQPRAHLGGLANTSGHTSQGYLGLTWDHQFESRVFVEFAFGFALHDGQLKGEVPPNNRPNLGSQVLFREGLDVGYRLESGHSIAVHASHISNAGWFAKENDGMNFVGARYGYRFD